MTPCACGCPQPARGNSQYASDACRARAWRRRVGYGAQKPLQGRSNGNASRSGPSGRQISYRKAVRALAAHLVAERRTTPEYAEHVAELVLSGALPQRQRKRP